MAGPLQGLRILEVATGVAAPYAGRLLAGLGAEVIKVEPPAGDRTRFDGPFPGDVTDPERSGLFLHLNAGKRSLVLDLPGERDALGPLLEGADVLLAGSTLGELRAWGLEPGQVAAAHPALVVTAVTQFGLSGPYAEFAGEELIAYALSGYMSLTGARDRKPIKAYCELIQYQAGVHAALGTMAALFARAFAGGQLVDVAAMEAGTFLLGGVEQTAYFYGRVERRNGTRLLGFPREHSYPSTIRPCRDGYVHVHSNNRHLDLLAALIPHPRLLDPEVLGAMMGHADEIDAICDEWLATRDRREIVAQAQALRLPFTEVMTPGEVLQDAHHRARGSFVSVQHPSGLAVEQPGAPMRFAKTPWVTGPAPLLGQHTAASLREGFRTPAAASPPLRGPKPLSGLRVLDFTNAIAGPIATAALADLGAEVIKVEAPGARPRRAAGVAPLQEGAADRPWDRILLYSEVNHGKRAVSLDVARPAGRDLFLRLVATADVVVENFSPRVLENLGLGYDALTAAREDIILVSMPAFGRSGPYRDRGSYGPGVDAMSGLSHLTGYPDGPPMKPGNFFCDQNAGIHAAFATLCAVRHRFLTGEGQHVELAMIEGEFQLLADAYMDFAMNGRERMRAANAHPRFAPHDVFPCAGEDAWVAIAAMDDEHWRALLRVVGAPGLAAVARRSPEVEAAIASWTRGRTPHAAMHALQAAGVPAGAVLDAGQILVDPHVRARDGYEYVDWPHVGPTPYPRVAFRLARTPVPVSGPAPAFAQDNAAIFGGELGLAPGELAALEAEGVIASEPTGAGH